MEETQDHSWGTNPQLCSSKSSSSSEKSKRLLLTVPVESGGRLAILYSDRTQQFKFVRAFGAIILAIKFPGVSSKSSSSSVKSKRLLLTAPVESGERLAILCSVRTQQFKFDRAFGAIILTIKSPGVSSKSSSSSAKSKCTLLTVPVESGGRLAILCSDRTRQFKPDRAFGAIILAIK